MIFRAKKNPPGAFGVQEIAGQLGLERRLHFRVNYPERTTAGLPAVFFEGRAFRVQDLSVGGCCLIDVGQILSGKAGVAFELELHFGPEVEAVNARLLTLVNDRRHIQFNRLSERRQAQLRDKMVFGVRAANLKPGLRALGAGPSMLAREMWTSLQGDSLVFESTGAREARAEIAGEPFFFYPLARPRDRFENVVSDDKLNQLILFFANIARPSPAVTALARHLERLKLGEVA